jgi:AcrR family transcriptional regulator
MRLRYHDKTMVSRQDPPPEDPRANQKDRTRTAILDAALRLLREDVTPTVGQAASEARVSRATAYRYFPTQDSLLGEVANLHPAVASVEEVVGNLDTDDVEERLLELLDTFNPIVLEEEVHMRTSLRVFQDSWLQARREGADAVPYARSRRRMRWVDEVLRPVQDLPDEQLRRLRAALALTLGIDSIVIMKDVCRLDDDEALAVLRWAARALLRAGLEGELPASG